MENGYAEHPILIVEDDRKAASTLSLFLRREGFYTIEAHDGAEVLSLWKESPLSFVLLDLMIPGIDGIEICKMMRKTSDLPIMMVTAKVEEADRLFGLSIGADDYVVKPFSPREVVARIKVILRRVRPREANGTGIISYRGFVINPKKHMVMIEGTSISLTPFEFRLLSSMIRTPGQVYSREMLLEKIYPAGEAIVLDRTVDSHIRNLREKIETDPARPRFIKTVRGIGYQFAEE